MGTNYYITLNETDSDAHIDEASFERIGGNRTIRFATLHVGKSSYGWAFHYRGYRHIGLDSFDSFKEFIDDPNRVLIDENGEIQDKNEFHDMLLTHKSQNYRNVAFRNKDHMNYFIEENSLSLATIKREMWHDDNGYSFWENNFS